MLLRELWQPWVLLLGRRKKEKDWPNWPFAILSHRIGLMEDCPVKNCFRSSYSSLVPRLTGSVPLSGMELTSDTPSGPKIKLKSNYRKCSVRLSCINIIYILPSVSLILFTVEYTGDNDSSIKGVVRYSEVSPPAKVSSVDNVDSVTQLPKRGSHLIWA